MGVGEYLIFDHTAHALIACLLVAWERHILVIHETDAAERPTPVQMHHLSAESGQLVNYHPQPPPHRLII